MIGWFINTFFSPQPEREPVEAVQPDQIDDKKDFTVSETNHLDKKMFQEKFLELVKYYNETVMMNTMVFSEEELLEYQKKIYEIEIIRRTLKLPSDSSSVIQTDSDFFKYIIKKVKGIQKTLSTYNKQLTYFYNRHRALYDTVSVSIIVLSSSMSMIQSLTLCFPSKYDTVSTAFTLVISTSIAVLTSVLKFKNIKEKLEELVRMKEKVHNCQAKLFTFDKELKTSLFLCSNNSNNEHLTIDTDDSRL
jgi:hypothetical protein